MSDNINHPKHYETGPFECIELSSRYSVNLPVLAGGASVWSQDHAATLPV